MRQIKIDGELYRCNRLAWLYVHGELPTSLVDHINLDPLDHRIANLRLATKAQNSANATKRKHNTSGFKGVFRRGDRWRAQISSQKVKYFLGSYSTPEAAHAAYTNAARRLHGEFARPE